MSREYVTRGGDIVRYVDRLDFRGDHEGQFRNDWEPIRDNSEILEAGVVIGFGCRYYASATDGDHSIQVDINGKFTGEWRVVGLPRSKFNPNRNLLGVVSPVFDSTIALRKFNAKPKQLGHLAIPFVFPDQHPKLDGLNMDDVDMVREPQTPLHRLGGIGPHLSKVEWGSIWYRVPAPSNEPPKSVQ